MGLTLAAPEKACRKLHKGSCRIRDNFVRMIWWGNWYTYSNVVQYGTMSAYPESLFELDSSFNEFLILADALLPPQHPTGEDQ